MKEGDEPSEFLLEVDAKKIPAPSAISKTVPSDYSLESLALAAVEGEASAKDGVSKFVAAGMDREYVLEKGEPAGPWDELQAALKDGAKKVALTGKVTEEKKDDKVVFKLAVTGYAKVEAKK